MIDVILAILFAAFGLAAIYYIPQLIAWLVELQFDKNEEQSE